MQHKIVSYTKVKNVFQLPPGGLLQNSSFYFNVSRRGVSPTRIHFHINLHSNDLFIRKVSAIFGLSCHNNVYLYDFFFCLFSCNSLFQDAETKSGLTAEPCACLVASLAVTAAANEHRSCAPADTEDAALYFR